jgi:hypothetical protein
MYEGTHMSVRTWANIKMDFVQLLLKPDLKPKAGIFLFYAKVCMYIT